MIKTFTPQEIGVVIQPDELVALFNDSHSGGFACIRKYVNRYGEVADHWVQAGINYGNILTMSHERVKAWLKAGGVPNLDTVEIHYKTWVNADGESSSKGKGRVPIKVDFDLQPNDQKIIKALRDLVVVLDPKREKQKGAEYDKKAKGFYGLDRADGKLMFYFRDCLTIGKSQPYVAGDYTTDSGEEIGYTTGEKAIRDAIRKELPVGCLRQFKFEVDTTEGKAGCGFDALTIDGVSILVGDPKAGEIWAALPAYAKQVVVNPVAADLLAQQALLV